MSSPWPVEMLRSSGMRGRLVEAAWFLLGMMLHLTMDIRLGYSSRSMMKIIGCSGMARS